MTRILVLTNMYPPHALGGYEHSCHDVMRRLDERGHEITIATTTMRLDGVDDPMDEQRQGVHRELEWYWNDHELTSPPVLSRLLMERRNQRRLRALIAEARPEVVSVWNVGAMSHGLLRIVAEAEIPIVYAVCDEWPVYGPHTDAWGRVFADRRLLGRAVEAFGHVPAVPMDLGPTGVWCFVSEHTRQACLLGAPFSFPVSTVVHSGIESSDFPIGVDADQVEDKGFNWQLLYVGRLDERKGVLTAVDALARLPEESTLTFAGRGDATDAIRRRANQMGVESRLRIAAYERSHLADVYSAADVFLFTSEWEEPFGLTPIEAMACGTPVVGTGTGGSDGFLIDEQTCLRYEPGDADGLARAIRRLADDPGLRARLRAGGRRLATKLTTDRLADTFEAWHVGAAHGFPDGLPPDRPLLGGRT